MILFLHGQEDFLIREKLAQITAKAEGQGTPRDAMPELAAGESSLDEVRAVVAGGSLFTDQQVVVLRNWLTQASTEEADQVVAAAQTAAPETIVVVAEFGEPDKRRSAYKQLTKAAAKSWTFPAMDETAAAAWLRQRAKSRDIRLSPAAVHRLVTAVGTDAWSLSTELEKLATAAEGEITPALVDELVVPLHRTDIFAMVDALSKRDAATALRLLRGLQDAGEPALKTFGLIVWQYRVLLGVLAMSSQGASDHEIAKAQGLHPFVVRKAKAQAKRFSESELRELYSALAELDGQMKTGQRDPDTALELFILEHCEKASA